MTTAHGHHTFDYIEIPSLDITASESFYRSAFGWTFNAYGPEYLGIVTPDGREAGGISAVGELSPGEGPLVVLFSDDIDATHDAVAAAGGRIVRDTFRFPGGRRFHFADPSGNELAVWGDPSD
jgi:predicted enzyme related to lactoylglutathione lyase